ncbi:MAG: M3 family oligoendopeptidase [Bacteroidetes bacterium]|nr:MAG: M3 family oligoendopeptidase [Bacteroidota bacterium]
MRATDESVHQEKDFISRDFEVTSWETLQPYYDDLSNRELSDVKDLEQWIYDRSKLEAIVSEAFGWRYINITRDSADEKAANLYQQAVQDLSPQIYAYENILDKKLVESPFFDHLDKDKFYVYCRNVKNAVDLFNEKNIPISTEVQLKSKEHGKIFSEMTIGVHGVQMTLQKAGSLLEETDRVYRESIYHKINQRILQDTKPLENLFDDLLDKRHQMATNAGFENFRDYKFAALGRFDYSVSDCLEFHDSIQYEILPLLDALNRYRREKLGLDVLRPWDIHVDTNAKQPLRPFETTQELLDKTVSCLNRLHPGFGRSINTMRGMKHLDLASRKGKRPGGYNMPLHLTGVPFIFMNATNTLNDLRTLLHESGHAVHAFLTSGLELNAAKRVPSEVAELAAMTMELLTMDHWDVFFENEDDLRRAKINQLETVLKVLPWVATIDKFQHWVYTNPSHSREERKAAWMNIMSDFSSKEIDNRDLEHYSEYIWHKQLHIFEVPFYYIEYGMAQLGAIAIWKNYRENPGQTIDAYINALKLGYTKPIGDIYETAGISFNFSRSYIQELGAFVKKELRQLLS